MEASGYRCPACEHTERQWVTGMPTIDNEWVHTRYVALVCRNCGHEWQETMFLIYR